MAPRIMRPSNRGLRRSFRPTPGWFATPAAVGVTYALLVGAVTLGVQLPGFGLLGRVGEEALDYSPAGRGRFQPLSDAYLSRVLGLPVIGGSAADSPDAPDAGPTGSSTGPSRGRATPDRAVAHEFTNDDFERAYEVSSLPFRGQTNIAGATRQPDEPADCLPAGGTAWYRYRSQATTPLFADTFGSGAPTSLGVYAGDSLGSLERLGCDTNALGNAQVGFRPLKETTYWFQVTSVRGSPTMFGLAAVGATTVQTLSPSGGRPDGAVHPGGNNRADISGNGRWLAFVSSARNLTPTPPDCGWPYCSSLYLRDRATGETKLVASGPRSGLDSGESTTLGHPALSPDGRYVGFTHVEIPGAPGFHGAADAAGPAVHAYLFDRVTGRFEIVSRNSAGEVARSEPGRNGGTAPGFASGAAFTGGSGAPSISSDGRYVTFWSDGANLGGHVEYGRAFNVYRRDRVTGTTRLVSVDAEGRPMRANSFACTGRNISGDGRYVFFSSTWGTGQDDHNISHLYLWDAETGRTRQVTKLPDGAQTLGSFCPSISLDGSRTAFVSRDALIPKDTNGTPDVYSYEVKTGRLERVSVTSAGAQTTDPNYANTEGSTFLPRAVSLSADGRYVAFDSSAPDLVPSWVGSTQRVGSGTPGPIQVYVHDVATGATVLASVSSTGEPLAGNSVVPYISPDGTAVSFMNSGLWTDRNSVTQLDVMVHELR